MVVFHYPQYEHKPCWSYFSKLNDFHAQLIGQEFEKWKIYEVVYVSVNGKTRTILD